MFRSIEKDGRSGHLRHEFTEESLINLVTGQQSTSVMNSQNESRERIAICFGQRSSSLTELFRERISRFRGERT